MARSRKLRVVFACAATLVSTAPAAAQIDGEWAVTLGGQPMDNVHLSLDRRSGRTLVRHSYDPSNEHPSFYTPKLFAALYTRDGVLWSSPDARLRAQLSLDGKFDGLAWSGWWYIADGVAQPRSIDRTFSNVCSEGFHLYPSGVDSRTARPERKTGQFFIQFNAAENTFSGGFYNNCRGSPQPDGGSSFTDALITGRRVGPTVSPRLRPVGSATLNTRLPRINQTFGEGTGPRTVILQLTDGGTTRAIELSKQYRIFPNSSDALAGDKFDLDVLVNQDRRPMRLRYRAIEFTAPPIVDSAARTTVLRGRFTDRSFSIGLPFVGVPPSGQSIYGLTYSGAFCGSFAWIPILDFGDQGKFPESNSLRPEAERSTMLWPVSSTCGARLNPAQVPAWAIRG